MLLCGSVDDGKSTLIGRLLCESGSVFRDEMLQLRQRVASGSDVDLSRLVDGLQAEREQGITIDVAHRQIHTGRRRLMLYDAPGHEEYTGNMASAASHVDLAIVLVDARKGVLDQTVRHTRILAMMGVNQIVLAINKIDLVRRPDTAFRRVSRAYAQLALGFGIEDVVAIPVSALRGDNVTVRSARSAWYEGPALLPYLEAAEGAHPVGGKESGFRMSIQTVLRASGDFRGYAGRIAHGSVRPGDTVRVLPAGTRTCVRSIVTLDRELEYANAGQSVLLTLTNDVDAGRGDVIVADSAPIAVGNQFETKLLWMDARPLVRSRKYMIRIHNIWSTCSVGQVRNVAAGSSETAERRTLHRNDIGTADLMVDRVVPFMPYTESHTLGSFIIVDPANYSTIGAGTITRDLRPASNIYWQPMSVDKSARARIKAQTPCCIWLTGLPASGKSTIADLLEKRLHDEGRHTYVLDGDNVRHGLSNDLGFSEADRAENIRRVAEVARLMVDAGLVVIVSFISPYRAERRFARSLFGADEFLEVHVDAPIEVCIKRDPKGLYEKARQGKIATLTGNGSPYESPESPDLRIDTVETTPAIAVDRIVSLIERQHPVSAGAAELKRRSA